VPLRENISAKGVITMGKMDDARTLAVERAEDALHERGALEERYGALFKRIEAASEPAFVMVDPKSICEGAVQTEAIVALSALLELS
jgi:hypothetical protein